MVSGRSGKWYFPKRVDDASKEDRRPEEAYVKGRIDFQYDRENDVIIARPHWTIETDKDVRDWYDQYAAYMKPFGRKMDFVVVLDAFEIKTAVGVLWGEARARMHHEFTRFNYRVHSNRRVQMFVNTSGVRYNVATEEAATVEDAIEGIKASRAALHSR